LVIQVNANSIIGVKSISVFSPNGQKIQVGYCCHFVSVINIFSHFISIFSKNSSPNETKLCRNISLMVHDPLQMECEFHSMCKFIMVDANNYVSD
jgi:hypothetical protein